MLTLALRFAATSIAFLFPEQCDDEYCRGQRLRFHVPSPSGRVQARERDGRYSTKWNGCIRKHLPVLLSVSGFLYLTGKQSRSFANKTGPVYRFRIST